MQKWFSLGGGEEDRQQPHPLTSSLSSSSSSSLLADWNSYASSKASEQNTALGVFDLDLESVVRSANDTVAGTFNVSKESVFAHVIKRGIKSIFWTYIPGCQVIFCKCDTFFHSHSFSHRIRQRLPFTLGFVGTMVGTIYVSMVLHSYILSVLFSVLQVLALAYYAVSYFPGGSAGMKFMLSGITSSIMKCFGR